MREEAEARSKHINDRLLPPLGGLTEVEANDASQDGYHVIPATEISQFIPEHIYPGEVMEGKVTTHPEWKNIPSFSKILDTHFPDFAGHRDS